MRDLSASRRASGGPAAAPTLPEAAGEPTPPGRLHYSSPRGYREPLPIGFCSERLPDSDGDTEYCAEPASHTIEHHGDPEGRCESCFQASREWGGYIEMPPTEVAAMWGQ